MIKPHLYLPYTQSQSLVAVLSMVHVGVTHPFSEGSVAHTIWVGCIWNGNCATLGLGHRRRKILKVGGAKDTIAREKFQTTPTLGQTALIFVRSMLPRLDFLHKRTNSKSSRADLAAT